LGRAQDILPDDKPIFYGENTTKGAKFQALSKDIQILHANHSKVHIKSLQNPTRQWIRTPSSERSSFSRDSWNRIDIIEKQTQIALCCMLLRKQYLNTMVTAIKMPQLEHFCNKDTKGRHPRSQSLLLAKGFCRNAANRTFLSR